MKDYINYIIDYSDKSLSENKRIWFEKQLVLNHELREKYMLFNHLNDTMRGKLDYNEVMNDPDRKSIDPIVNQMVSEFNQTSERFNSAKQFILNSINGNENSELANELEQTKQDVLNSNISNETQKLVDEWIEKKTSSSIETSSRRQFITSSLNTNEDSNIINRSAKKRNFTIGLIGLATAATLAAVLLIKNLSPAYTPDSIYSEFYKPLNAYSATTRNNANVLDPFSNAVALYNQGKYKSALDILSKLFAQEPKNQAYLFFIGITYMGLEEYNDAIVSLGKVVSSENEDYKKEAEWYLGLSYLKTGDTKNAIVYINELSKTNGYYQSSAQDLLDRLK